VQDTALSTTVLLKYMTVCLVALFTCFR